ncbi:MAG: DUF309 domain-containing protein [Anaerolineales bacterium]
MPASIHPRARRGIELFNKGEYFEAHEELEGAWLETQPPERDLYQGILQIGLAYYHISRGNYGGALKMFHRGQLKLENLSVSMMGINISQFIEDASIVESNLRDLGDLHTEKLNRDLIRPVPLIE